MQATQQHQKAFELPNGYGPLIETLQVTGVPNLEGTLFVHERSGGEGRVASLRLRVGQAQVTYKHLWEPRSHQESRNGSRLLFRNAPNTTRGEGWDSEEFQARHVKVYEGRQGLFAIVPFGEKDPATGDRGTVVPLARQASAGASKARPFDAAFFQATAAQMRASVQAKDTAEAAPPVVAEDAKAKVLAAVKANEGNKGARWDAIVEAVGLHGIGPDAAEAALNQLMDDGKAYEPTLGIIKSN